MSRKVIRVTPATTGMAASALLSKNPKINSARRLAPACSLLLAVAHVDVFVPGARAVLVPGADVEVLHALADPPDALRVGDQRRRQVAHQDLLDLGVDLPALAPVYGLHALVEEPVDVRVPVAGAVQRAVADGRRLVVLRLVGVGALRDAEK